MSPTKYIGCFSPISGLHAIDHWVPTGMMVFLRARYRDMADGGAPWGSKMVSDPVVLGRFFRSPSPFFSWFFIRKEMGPHRFQLQVADYPWRGLSVNKL